MGRYRKKPVEIEALQLPDAGRDQHEAAQFLARWCDGYVVGAVEGPLSAITIRTLEGDHLASPGDWIIRGVKGEFYPCKPDIFEATYDPVT
jgi:hypothetical protein